MDDIRKLARKINSIFEVDSSRSHKENKLRALLEEELSKPNIFLPTKPAFKFSLTQAQSTKVLPTIEEAEDKDNLRNGRGMVLCQIYRKDRQGNVLVRGSGYYVNKTSTGQTDKT
jgi:hypothetical protein